MPNKPRPDNPHRMVRVEDHLWEAAKAAAAANDTTVSAVIRAALDQYVKRSALGTPASLDEWAISDLTEQERDDLMTALAEARASRPTSRD